MQKLGANVIKYGNDCGLAEVHARQMAANEDKVFVSPYNDPDVMAGQGTIARELLSQIPDLGVVYVSLGGGGLIGGIGLYLKAVKPGVEVVACSASVDPCMHLSMEAGKVVDNEHNDTLAEALAGGLEQDTITLKVCKQVIDRSLLVEEVDI